MYIKVKLDKNETIIPLSKTTTIENLRSLILNSDLKVDPEEQYLLFKGKQLVDGHRIVDYGIEHGNVVQLFQRPKIDKSESKASTSDTDKSDTENTKPKTTYVSAESKYYQVGDLVDFRSVEDGGWYEARVTEIVKPETSKENDGDEKELVFKVKCEPHVSIFTFDGEVKFDELRPASYYTYKTEELKKGMTALVNYNIDNPKERGLWFDFMIDEVTRANIKGEILLGPNRASLKNCSVKFIQEIMRIESPVLLEDKPKENNPVNQRKYPYHCDKCKDDQTKNCSQCGCQVCKGKEKLEQMLMCDECDNPYHMFCLSPPLTVIPDDDWYCPSCKNDDTEIVRAGEKLKHSNKRAKMPSTINKSNRDWGKGMACAGRTKECTIVSKYHVGPIPGIEVGMCWKFRIQVSEAGVHRPPVAGIHGRESECAYSLVLSGGYEGDIDNGTEFIYSGAGGRDLSGNKRVSGQTCNQELNRTNKALAINCNAPFNEKGAESKDWKQGKPVRVLRSSKLEKVSKYAPKDGYRYDGIYKVVKYYPEKEKSGHLIWKYVLRRDDDSPAPWEKKGKEFDVIYPEGYVEAQEADLKLKMEQERQKSPSKKSLKRKASDKSENVLTKFVKLGNSKKTTKTNDVYKLEEDIDKAITSDELNKKLWDECKEFVKEGKLKFLEKVQTVFKCTICMEVYNVPMTLECKHTICKGCLKMLFSSGSNTCPNCREVLNKNDKIEINENLRSALQLLFPKYEK